MFRSVLWSCVLAIGLGSALVLVAGAVADAAVIGWPVAVSLGAGILVMLV